MPPGTRTLIRTLMQVTPNAAPAAHQTIRTIQAAPWAPPITGVTLSRGPRMRTSASAYSARMAQRAMERAVSMYSSLFSKVVGAPQLLKTSAFHSGVKIDMSAIEKMPRQTVLR